MYAWSKNLNVENHWFLIATPAFSESLIWVEPRASSFGTAVMKVPILVEGE